MKNKLKTLVLLTGLTTAMMQLINKVNNSICTAKNYLSNASNNYYEWRFGKIRYSKKGTGNPIVLLHDLTCGSSNYEFHFIFDSLSKTNEVFKLDLLGYGLSDKPDLTYTNFLYVQLLTDFIKNIVGKKVTVIATGDSAPITIMAGHNDPEIIDKMVLINPQNLFNLNQIPSKQTKLMKFIIELPIIGTFFYNILSTKSYFKKVFKNDYIYDHFISREKEILTYLEASHLPNNSGNGSAKYSFASYIGRYMNANIIHALKEINHSIYIIAGEEKNDIQTIAENYHYYNNAIEIFYIPKTKHLPHLESPDEVINNLKFLL